MTCEHEDFAAFVDVARVTSEEGGPVAGFYAEVRVECVQCAEPFVFRGLPVGLSQAQPCISPDGLELRVPCLPQSADPHFGLGLPGFAARVREGEPGARN